MATVKLEQKHEYTRIIDSYLRGVDLVTVTPRAVRAHLQSVLGQDLTNVKDEIKTLIAERFDAILDEEEANPNSTIKQEIKAEASSPRRRIKHDVDGDAKYAEKLQRELNASDRPSRSSRRPAPKRKVIKKKSNAHVDSDGSGEDGEPQKKKRAINRNNPFNAPMQLSEPLSALLGKPECSRPECVKLIWEYVKKNGLQDPSDGRYIICDDPMKPVFGNSERVHMFTMNKYLSNHLHPLPKKESGTEEVLVKTEIKAEASEESGISSSP